MNYKQVEKDIRETTEVVHGRKIPDDEWEKLWTDLLLYQEYGPRREINFDD